MKRRTLLRRAGQALLMSAGALAGCDGPMAPSFSSRWVGPDPARGHRLKTLSGWPSPSTTRRTRVLVLGSGIAGLAALRRLHLSGIDDAWGLELQSHVGGNSLGHVMAGMACPLGAHYLPVPSADAAEVQDFLVSIGLLKRDAQGVRPVERYLCHALQERLFIDGGWQEGLLPNVEDRPSTLAQYRRFADRVAVTSRSLDFRMPTLDCRWTPAHAELDAQPFATWLAREKLTDEWLLGYLDYCCRDDYGAGIDQVSAWAGLHYFASRHGFHAPGDAAAETDQLFTWPQGNAALVQAMTGPLQDRLLSGRCAVQIRETQQAVEVLVWDIAQQKTETWVADRIIVALPLSIAARLLQDWADPLAAALQTASQQQPHAPWLVANLHMEAPLFEREGVPLAWDNVRFSPAGQTTSLGYVDAMHQSWRTYDGPTVLTAYHALPVSQRSTLLRRSADDWAAYVLADLARVHPDAPEKVRGIDLARWGHAMSIPTPGIRSASWLAALRNANGRIRFAHADLSGYSVFEEAFTLGERAAQKLKALR